MPPRYWPAVTRALNEYGLRYAQAFHLDDLITEVSRRRNRPITIYEMPPNPELSATMWIATPDGDWLCIQSGLAPFHRTHVTLHEIGHIVLGHVNPTMDTDDPTKMMQHCDTRLLESALRRSLTDSQWEREAEQFALLTSPRAITTMTATATAPDDVTAAIDRFAVAMGAR